MDTISNAVENRKYLGFLRSTVEAFDTFLFVPNKVTCTGAHIRDSIDSKRSMIIVVIALMPALLFGMFNVGHQHYLSIGLPQDIWNAFVFGLFKVVPLLVVSYVVGLSIEFASAQIRKEQVNEGFLVTGLLIPMICPPNMPLWIVALATAFAVIIGKEIFGGTGMNIWNPALLARAFMFFSYPIQMSGDSVWIADKADAYSGATALSLINDPVYQMPSITDLLIGTVPGSIGETSKIAILIGAIMLVWTGVASFKIMISVIAGGLATVFLFNNIGGETPLLEVAPLDYICMGGFLFGAVFMATDPVTSTQTRSGKWIYGLLIGVVAVVIRTLNPAYPEGMMMSILLMNTFAPLIDYIVVENHKKNRKNRILKYQNSI